MTDTKSEREALDIAGEMLICDTFGGNSWAGRFASVYAALDELDRFRAENQPKPPGLYWNASLASGSTRLSEVETTRIGELVMVVVRVDGATDDDRDIIHGRVTDAWMGIGIAMP